MTKKEVEQVLVEILNDMIEMYELPEMEITAETKLIEDLGFSSVDIMHMLATADMRFQAHVPYEEMVLKDGEYVTELAVGEVAAYVSENIHRATNEPQNMAE
ncbi:MAG TPA: hypothetical protein PKE06_07855 [Flavilitoribacter sp.]|nr:hypothetical protein [Flavilitoribacter sp.]HMQ87370.1 hypothetical protein [Flavilitoribacter sp.]